MRVFLWWIVLQLASAALLAQTPDLGSPVTTSAVTADDIRQLREVLAAQQQQIQQLREQLVQRDQQMQQQAEAIRQLQAGIGNASKGQSAEPAKEVVTAQNDVSGIESIVRHSPGVTQEEQQHTNLYASTSERFRFSSDVRLRYDGTVQD